MLACVGLVHLVTACQTAWSLEGKEDQRCTEEVEKHVRQNKCKAINESYKIHLKCRCMTSEWG